LNRNKIETREPRAIEQSTQRHFKVFLFMPKIANKLMEYLRIFLFPCRFWQRIGLTQKY